jgi:hypothetical protein
MTEVKALQGEIEVRVAGFFSRFILVHQEINIKEVPATDHHLSQHDLAICSGA